MTLRLDRLSRYSAFAEKDGSPSGAFITLWQRTVTKIEAQEAAQDSLLASMDTALAQINDILSGATDVPIATGAYTWTAQQTFNVAPEAVAYKVGGDQVVGARDTGWTASTGTPNKAAYATYAGQTMGGAYSQTVAQTNDDALKAVSQRVKALEDALFAHGLIGT